MEVVAHYDEVMDAKTFRGNIRSQDVDEQARHALGLKQSFALASFGADKESPALLNDLARGSSSGWVGHLKQRLKPDHFNLTFQPE
jgi:hypothetical protein